MFDADCPTCGGMVLLGPRSILDLRNEADGIVLRYRCHCGTEGTQRLGRRAAVERASVG